MTCVNVVIPHFNTPDVLQQCLQSIKAHTPEAHRIIVVDDGSAPEIREGLWQLKRECEFDLLPLLENKGFTEAVNAGIKEAEPFGGDYLLLNSDMVVSPGWLEALQGALAEGESIGIVCSQTRDGYDESFVQCGGCVKHSEHITGWADRGECQEMRIDQDLYFPFASVLIRRQALQDVGLLDEQFKIYCSDEDWCRRAKARGWLLCYQPRSIVYHKHGYTIGRRLHEEKFRKTLAQDQERFAKKYSKEAESIPA